MMTEPGRLEEIVESIRESFEAKTALRDQALKQSRTLVRHCSLAIRAVHRGEASTAETELADARRLVGSLQESLSGHPELYHAGYTQDALKEFAEASLVEALIAGKSLPTPEELGVEDAAYMAGLGEAAGELRRRILDILRHNEYEESERLLDRMDEIYGMLVTMDYPDAVTRSLRRITDMVRGVTERTRGDLTTSYQQFQLQEALRRQSEENARADG
jgi:translin